MKLPKLPKIEMFGIDIIKNMLFFTTFVLIFLFLLAVLVAPSIKKFKSTKIEYFKIKTQLDNSNQQLEKMTFKYNKLYQQNKKMIFAFKRDFDKNNFKNFSAKFMKITNIKEINKTIIQDDFLKTTYIITSTINSPTQFYKFVNNTKNYKNILKVYFPIVFKSKNGEIKLLYKLEHFKIK